MCANIFTLVKSSRFGTSPLIFQRFAGQSVGSVGAKERVGGIRLSQLITEVMPAAVIGKPAMQRVRQHRLRSRACWAPTKLPVLSEYCQKFLHAIPE